MDMLKMLMYCLYTLLSMDVRMPWAVTPGILPPADTSTSLCVTGCAEAAALRQTFYMPNLLYTESLALRNKYH
jgi:hypothetical protein